MYRLATGIKIQTAAGDRHKNSRSPHCSYNSVLLLPPADLQGRSRGAGQSQNDVLWLHVDPDRPVAGGRKGNIQ